MKKFPKPWYRPSRGVWYVTLGGKQHNLGPDRDAAFEQYRKLLAAPPAADSPEPPKAPPTFVVGLIQRFMADLRANAAPQTVEWYRYPSPGKTPRTLRRPRFSPRRISHTVVCR
jgi:hypothetical protein